MIGRWVWPADKERGHDPYYEDRGRSEPWTYEHNGETRTTPAKWSERWIQSLPDEEFYSLQSALINEDYWTCMNLRTLHARSQLSYRERERRQKGRKGGTS